MPTINVALIEGYDAMTPEQKIEALTKFEIPESVDMGKYVSKEVFDKKASEAASLSKQLKDKMSDDEKKAAEKAEADKKILEELEALKKDKAISDLKANYLKIGYDAELADSTAKAQYEGDMKTVFDNAEKHRAAEEKRIREELMKRTPKPDGSGGGNDDGKDPAVEKAIEIAKARHGGDKAYQDILNKYKKL